MTEANRDLIERVVSALAESEDLRGRFREAPAAVVTELTGGPVDEATMQALEDRVRERLGEELSDDQLEGVAGGFMRNLSSMRPRVGRTTSFSSAISMN